MKKHEFYIVDVFAEKNIGEPACCSSWSRRSFERGYGEYYERDELFRNNLYFESFSSKEAILHGYLLQGKSLAGHPLWEQLLLSPGK